MRLDQYSVGPFVNPFGLLCGWLEDYFYAHVFQQGHPSSDTVFGVILMSPT